MSGKSAQLWEILTLSLSPPQSEPDPILDNYVLLVVVMSLFVGGTLVVLSGVLLLCKRCWEVHQRFNRYSPTPPPQTWNQTGGRGQGL